MTVSIATGWLPAGEKAEPTLAGRIPAPPCRRIMARLGFQARHGLTFLSDQFTPHPFHVTRPFRIEGDPPGMATVYLQSSAGGLYGDDDLSLAVTLSDNALVHLTTQASSVVHHARGRKTLQGLSLDLGAQAELEYCPDPVILFAGARLHTTFRATLGRGSQLILTDAALPHDPSGNDEPFEYYSSEVLISDAGGAPLLVDRFGVSGLDWAKRMAGKPCLGTLICAGATDSEGVALALRTAWETGAGGNVYAGVSAFPARGVVVARVLASDGATLSELLRSGWAAARCARMGNFAPDRPK